MRPPRSRMGEKESCPPGRGERYRRHTELQRQAYIYKTQAAPLPSSSLSFFLPPAGLRVCSTRGLCKATVPVPSIPNQSPFASSPSCHSQHAARAAGDVRSWTRCHGRWFRPSGGDCFMRSASPHTDMASRCMSIGKLASITDS